MNYYQILGVPQDATTEQIKQRYKVLIKTYHPDLYKGDKTFANEKTKEITQAYKLLVNPTTRNDYDMLLYDEYIESNSAYDYNYEDTHDEDVDEFNNEYKDEDFFNNSSKKYKHSVFDYVDKTYDTITSKSLDYILNSNSSIRLLFSIVLILIVIFFFLSQVKLIQQKQSQSIKSNINTHSSSNSSTYVDQAILDSITIEDLKEEFGDDIVNQIENGTFEDIDELKTFYYLYSDK